jgi:hypothetical protein
MVGKPGKTYAIVLLTIFLIGTMANGLILLSYSTHSDVNELNESSKIENEKTQNLGFPIAQGPSDTRAGSPRGNGPGVVGPLELLHNSDLSTGSSWDLHDAYNETFAVTHTLTSYNSGEGYIEFVSDVQIEPDETPFDNYPIRAKIEQNFTKDCWTSTTPNKDIVIFSFNYRLTEFVGTMYTPPSDVVFGEFYLEIENRTSGNTAEWPLVASESVTGIINGGSFVTGDNRVTNPPVDPIVVDVSQPPLTNPTFSIHPPGQYRLALIFQLYSESKTTEPDVFTQYNVWVDNVSLKVNDNSTPLMYNTHNDYSFGPYNDVTYNNETFGRIDIDFNAEFINNTPLKLGLYRLNNSGSAGSWNRIFATDQSHKYEHNWSISGVWSAMNQGENTIDVYCKDQVGNYNGTLQITVFKDTIGPNSNTSELEQYYTSKNVNITYTATDPGLVEGTSGGFNNTVVLMFKNSTMNSYINYTPDWNPSGLFNHSSIRFNIQEAGDYGEGEYSFYTIAIDNTSNIETAPASPDSSTTIDYIKPVSEANELDALIDVRTFDISYDSSDATSGIDYVELWYELNDIWNLWNDTGGNTNFSSSPISFTAPLDGIYGFYTVAYDNAGNIEKGGLPHKGLTPTIPDTTTQVDSQAPAPKFLIPVDNAKISGKETLVMWSDFDTEYLEIYYWVDMDKDTNADDINDVNSSWVLIDNLSSPISGTNWTTKWNTKLSPELNEEEEMVVLKAVGADGTNKKGSGTTYVEVDNKEPNVIINSPEDNSAENGNSIFINYTTDSDVQFINIYYKIIGPDNLKEKNFNLIKAEYEHNYGTTTGTYKWDLKQSLRDQSPEVEIKIEAYDDVGNEGNSSVTVGINWAYPIILETFPTTITQEEDFNKFSLALTQYESHTGGTITGDNLKWYVTGNSRTLFYLTGDNSTGANADTFVFRSIDNMNGVEELTYHLRDPQGLEATKKQTFTVTPVNDAPKFSPPVEVIHVAVDEADTFDLSPYISDVDNALSELTITTDDTSHITVDGMKLIFNYGKDMKDKTKTIKVTISDLVANTKGNLNILITTNHRPKLIKPFPTDIELKGGETKDKVLNLNDHFTDLDGDTLVFTSDSDNIIITINSDGTIDLEAKEDVDLVENVKFRATDPQGAFADGYMPIKITDINNPPRIKDIPDIHIHYLSPSDDQYSGYTYDFSYFISDPDNELSELSIRGVPVESNLIEYVQKVSGSNMKLVFKFPFEIADGKKHPVYLYVTDPQNAESRKLFNVTVIIDNWPVEQIANIEDQSFEEDGAKDNAFKLDFYFEDKDGGTTYEIITKDNSKIDVEIDSENYVDLTAGQENWYGEEEITILARDTQPEQYVYATFTVFVTPVNDKPVISEIPIIKVEKGKREQFNLAPYISDIDTDKDLLTITTADPDNIEVVGHTLYIKYNKVGDYTIEVAVFDDGMRDFDTTNIVIQVRAKEVDERVPSSFYYIIGAVIAVVIVILALLMFMFTRYKVHEVFLIHQSGILLHHLSREHIPGRDEEILSGMFTAVQEFIKDSFSTSGRQGRTDGDDYVLREMKIGDNNNILIERGKYVYLAVIFSGRGRGKLRTKVRNILEEIETKYEMPFKTWVGDMDKLAGVDRLLQSLIPEGGRPVMVSDRQLGRVPAPRPGTPAPGPAPAPAAPAPVTPKPVTTIPTAPKPASVTPVAVKPVQPAQAQPQPAKAVTPVRPAQPMPATPTAAKPAVIPAPAPAAAKPAVAAAKPAAPAPAVKPDAPICPKCGATANKFPDGSLLCPKCGYTGK